MDTQLPVDNIRNWPMHIARAFSHFTYHASAGALMIVDVQVCQCLCVASSSRASDLIICSFGALSLQGVNLMFSDPIMHMRDGHGQTGSFGAQGFAAHFSTHRCNAVCEKLGLKVPTDQKFEQKDKTIDRSRSSEPAEYGADFLCPCSTIVTGKTATQRREFLEKRLKHNTPIQCSTCVTEIKAETMRGPFCMHCDERFPRSAMLAAQRHLEIAPPPDRRYCDKPACAAARLAKSRFGIDVHADFATIVALIKQPRAPGYEKEPPADE